MSRFYRTLLKLYSADTRARNGRQMQETFEDAVSAARDRGRFAVVLLYVKTTIDALLTALPDRLGRRQAGVPRQKSDRLASLWYDARHSVRSFRRQPAFTMAAIATVALGIGATSTILSVANSMLARDPDGLESTDELVTLHLVSLRDGSSFHSFSWLFYEDLQNGTGDDVDIAAFSTFGGSLTADGEANLALGFQVSPNFFEVLGTRMHLGRGFHESENQIGNPTPVAIITYGTWASTFGADTSVVGREVTLNGAAFTLVGVTEPGFSGHIAMIQASVFVPVAANPLIQVNRADDNMLDRGYSWLELVGRLNNGTSLVTAQERLSKIADDVVTEFNAGGGIDLRAYSPIFAAAVGPVSAFMAMLLAVTSVILLIASVNVGGMLLARASGRSQEIAIRLAMGAKRGRLIRQLVTESVILFSAGGILGAAITYTLTALIKRPPIDIPIPVVLNFKPEPVVLLVTFALAMLTGLIFGLAPAVQSTRADLVNSLREGARTGGSNVRLRRVFVVAQVAGSALLLAMASLLSRAMAEAGMIDPGFDPDGMAVAELDLSTNRYTEETAGQFVDQLLAELRGSPEIESATVVDNLPLGFSNSRNVVSVPGREELENVGRFTTRTMSIDEDYFEVFRSELTSGQMFSSVNPNSEITPVVLNEELAKRIWPDESPLGRILENGDDQLEVVAVAATGKYGSLAELPEPVLFWPFSYRYRSSFSVAVRARTTEAAASAALRNAIKKTDPNLPTLSWGSYNSVLAVSMLPNRIATLMALSFGAAGLLLAMIGVYGLLAFSVSQRTREIGLRIALGAGRRGIRTLILRDGLKLSGIGLVIGLLGAAGASTALVNLNVPILPFGIEPVDPLMYLGVALFVTAVAAAACWIPARRATVVNPVSALKAE